MSLQIIHIAAPELPFSIPLPGGLGPTDKLQISANIQQKSRLEITFKASDEEKIDSRIPLNLSVTLDGIACKCGKNKIWEVVETKPCPIHPGTFLLTITSDKDEYRIEIDGNLYSTFAHRYPPFASEFLEINVCEGSAHVKSVSYTREMKWLGTRIGLPAPDTAFKCGKDEDNNDIYLGRGLKNNNMLIVSANPSKNEATVAFNGREWPMHHYELLQDNSYYGWKLIGDDKKVPDDAVEGGFNDKGEITYIGRVTNEASVIPGTLDKTSCILSIPYKDKEIKFSSRFEVLTVLSPMEVKNKKNPSKFEPKADTTPKVTPPKNDQECIVCFTEDINTAFIPCGHMALCETCSKECLKSDNRCPVCRKPVTSYLKTYKAV